MSLRIILTGSNATLVNTELKETTKNMCRPVFEQQETPSYVALVWPVESTQLESGPAVLFRDGVV